MTNFTKESLENLRQRIDLIEVLSPYVRFSRSGAFFKGLCPFHQEKTPSFVLKRGDFHYHCYGCGAHGDAIEFLMSHQNFNFTEAVEYLADKFNIALEVEKGKSKDFKALKNALEKACMFFHFFLLHTKEGHEALFYLYQRGISLDFIKTFQIGYAPRDAACLLKLMKQERIEKKFLKDSGLLSTSSKGEKCLFAGRITFPIRDILGRVIGFSARKIEKDAFGPKYINSSETPLFKKSRVLFGLNYSRRTIAKEKIAVIVEGQIDALRLIYFGFNNCIASQGTAFGEEHVEQLLKLGVNKVFLAMDSDEAGKKATMKIGDLLQKKAIEVKVVKIEKGKDPDLILQEEGPDKWNLLLRESTDYLSFMVEELSKRGEISSPAFKSRLVQEIAALIKKWENPLMVHESLKRLALLTNTSESLLDMTITKVCFKNEDKILSQSIDADFILEKDFLLWLFLMGEKDRKFIKMAKMNLSFANFQNSLCKGLYEKYLEKDEENSSKDLLSLAIDIENEEEKRLFFEILEKKVDLKRAEKAFTELLEKILSRDWIRARERIKCKIDEGNCEEDEMLSLVKEFSTLVKKRPKILLPD